MESRALAPGYVIPSAAGLVLLLVVCGLAAFGFPRWGTSAFVVSALAVLVVLGLAAIVGRRQASVRTQAFPTPPNAQAGDDTPQRLADARRRAAERRAKGPAKTKVKRG